MWCWLNENSGAVQAIAAVVVVGLTATLVWVTWQYVRLTKRISETAQRQLSAAMQPVLSLEVLEEGTHFKFGERIKIRGTIGIANRGQQPVKIKAISAVVRLRSTKETEPVLYPITDRDNLVLMPNDRPDIRDFVLFTDFVYNAPTENCSLGIYVDCTDLAGVSEHSFFYDQASGLRHYFGFKKPVEQVGLRSKLKRLKARLDQWASFENKHSEDS